MWPPRLPPRRRPRSATCARPEPYAPPVEPEVVVQLDGLPRPATVLQRRAGEVKVRFRHAGGYVERWVPESAVLPVEPSTRPPYVKIVGLAVLAVLGLLLLLWPGGSDRPLVDSTPTPTATAAP